MFFVIVFCTAFGLAFGLTPLAAWAGRRWGMADAPGGRRRHTGLVPRTGGIALYLAFTLTIALTLLLSIPRHDLPNEFIRLRGLLLGGAIIFAYGLADDRWNLNPRLQLAIQVVASGVAIAHLIFIEYIFSPIDNTQIDFPFWFTLVLSLFWLMGMTNTVNWLDGLDGLATGVTAISSLVLFINAAFRLDPPQTSVSLLPLALAGTCLGFLPWNFHPARVFMGSGAVFLGFTLGCLSIIGGAKAAAVLLVMAIPIMDVAWLIVSRIRRGQSPLLGGRDHLHFRLVDAGYSQRIIVLGYYAFCAAFGGLTLLVSSRLFKLIALLALGLLAIGVLWLAETRQSDKGLTQS
jgi:UDP-GlcNAc:undecaprenyl-phosphate GlcNAc-1-phosphate transferase